MLRTMLYRPPNMIVNEECTALKKYKEAIDK